MRIIHDSQLREYEDRAVAQQESLECLKQESRSYRAIAERAEAMQTNLKRELVRCISMHTNSALTHYYSLCALCSYSQMYNIADG